MSTIAPVANYEGTLKTVSREVLTVLTPSITLNNNVLNNVQRNTPVMVGMGNSIKIYIAYNLPPAITQFTISLYWLQRAKDKFDQFAGPGNTNTKDTPARDAEEVIRTMETPLGVIGGVNDAAFFDVVAEKVASGVAGLDYQEIRWQQIDLPLTTPPVSDALLPVTGGIISAFAGQGVVYECIAKADELFLVSQMDPDVTFTYPGDAAYFCGVDIAIGANAQGDQK